MNSVHVPLYRMAHSRTGDKGNISNISVIAWQPFIYPVLLKQLSAECIQNWFSYRSPERVDRYVLPQLHAMNFVLHQALDGGVNAALNLDAHGKSLSFHLLNLPVLVPQNWLSILPDIKADPAVHFA